jgi:membrane metallo-endopeptidase-like protein 1
MYKLFSFLGDIENWWAPGTDKLFKEKAECIIKQYGNFVDQSVGVHLNGISNQGENIADNGGAKASYNAYGKFINLFIPLSDYVTFKNH